MRRYVYFIFNFLCVLSYFLANPANAATSNNKEWSSFTVSGNKGAFLYSVEPQLRLIEQPNIYNQFLFNMGGGYQASPHWEFWLGQTYSTIAQDTVSGSQQEYRLWEQAVWKQNMNGNGLNIRSRLEERRSFNFTEWAYRIRNRVLLVTPLTPIFSFDVSDELFINLNNASWLTTGTWDQNRLYAGITQKVSPIMTLSVGYMLQYIFTEVPQADNVLVVNMRVNFLD